MGGRRLRIMSTKKIQVTVSNGSAPYPHTLKAPASTACAVFFFFSLAVLLPTVTKSRNTQVSFDLIRISKKLQVTVSNDTAPHVHTSKAPSEKSVGVMVVKPHLSCFISEFQARNIFCKTTTAMSEHS